MPPRALIPALLAIACAQPADFEDAVGTSGAPPPPKPAANDFTHGDPASKPAPPPPPKPAANDFTHGDPVSNERPAPPPPPKPAANDFTHGDPASSPPPPPSEDAPRPPDPPRSPLPPPYPPIVSTPCDARVNLTLILDASGSMQSSLEAVRQLSHNLVGLLDFSHSRAAVHGFHDSAHVIQEMTSVASDVEAAIDAHGTSAYPIGGGTNVDVAFSQIPPLASSGSEIRIAVLISDGFFPMGSFVALTLANELKADGVLIYTLSLGAMVSSDFLHALASAPSTHFAIGGPPVELWAAMSQNLCAMCGPIEDAWEETGCCEDETPLACQELLISANSAQCDEC